MKYLSIITILLESYNENELVTRMINDTISHMYKYVHIVKRQEAMIQDAPKDKVIEALKQLEPNRREAHNNVIDGIKAINRLCLVEELDMFCPHEDNMGSVSDFVINIARFLRRMKLGISNTYTV